VQRIQFNLLYEQVFSSKPLKKFNSDSSCRFKKKHTFN